MAQAAPAPEALGFGFELYDKQQAFIDARRTHKWRWFFGGRQGGKTEVGAGEAGLHAMHRPGTQGGIFAPSYPHAIVARQRFEAFVPYRLRTWNGADRIWRVKTLQGGESVVHLRSLSDPDAPRGLTLDWGWMDECAMYSEEAFANLVPTFAVADADVWGTTTPRGHNWTWQRAVKYATDRDFVVHAASIENPRFPAEEWERIKAQLGEDSPRFRQEYLGLFEAFIGQAFPHFHRTVHTDHVDASPWPFVGCWDVGWTAPTVYVWAQVSPEDVVVLRGCRTWTETERVQILPEVAQLPPVREHWIPTDMTYGDRQAGDPGWMTDMRERGWATKSKATSRITESRRLGLIRQWLHQERLVIDLDGEGAELLIEAFEMAELNRNPEKDVLADSHPHTDILDAVGQLFARLYGHAPITVTIH